MYISSGRFVPPPKSTPFFRKRFLSLYIRPSAFPRTSESAPAVAFDNIVAGRAAAAVEPGLGAFLARPSFSLFDPFLLLRERAAFEKCPCESERMQCASLVSSLLFFSVYKWGELSRVRFWIQRVREV